MEATVENIKQLIQKGMPEAQVIVNGDGRHFEAKIVSREFVGKSRIQRHQLVYKFLGDSMKEDIHAISISTITPEEN